jgi:hypothetical protein
MSQGTVTGFTNQHAQLSATALLRRVERQASQGYSKEASLVLRKALGLSPVEIRLRWQNLGIDIVTMNFVSEVFFARELEMCYAAIDLVSNYGEGLIDPRWEGNTAFKEFQKKWSSPTSEAILSELRVMDPDDDSCGCSTYRWDNILL